MEGHQNEETKSVSDIASGQKENPGSGFGSKLISMLLSTSDNDGIEWEDALLPLNSLNRNGESLSGTPVAVDEEDDGASDVPPVKTPSFSPAFSSDTESLVLTWPTVDQTSSERQPSGVGLATEPQNVKGATKPEVAEHTTEPGTEISGEQDPYLDITAVSPLDPTTQNTLNDALGVNEQVTTIAVGQDGSDATNRIYEPMASDLVGHQDEETKPASDKASVLAEDNFSDITTSNMVDQQDESARSGSESKPISVLGDASDNDATEREDLLQVLETLETASHQVWFPTPVAIDGEDDVPIVKTPDFSPTFSPNSSLDTEPLELTWPSVNRSDRNIGQIWPEDSVSNRAESVGSPMILDSETEEDPGTSGAGAGIPPSGTLSSENDRQDFQNEHSLMRCTTCQRILKAVTITCPQH